MFSKKALLFFLVFALVASTAFARNDWKNDFKAAVYSTYKVSSLNDYGIALGRGTVFVIQQDGIISDEMSSTINYQPPVNGVENGRVTRLEWMDKRDTLQNPEGTANPTPIKAGTRVYWYGKMGVKDDHFEMNFVTVDPVQGRGVVNKNVYLMFTLRFHFPKGTLTADSDAIKAFVESVAVPQR